MQVFHSTSCSIAYCAFWHELNGCRVALAVPNRWCWKTNTPLWEGEDKILSFIHPLLPSLCEANCFTAQFKPDQGQAARGSCQEPSLVPSLQFWGIWDGTMCVWIPQGGGETLNKPSLLPFCPWGFPVSGGRNVSPLRFQSPAWLCRALWMCSVWAKG